MRSDKSRVLLSDVYILLASAVWGFAFVAQRASIDIIGPFCFNGIRFGLGGISLIPLWLLTRKKGRYIPASGTVVPSVIVGILLFAGVSLQQISLLYTTAGNAGFITGLYVVIVPIAGIFFHRKIPVTAFAAAFLALAGLFFLSVGSNLSVNRGDLLVLISTFFWSAHVIYIGRLSGVHDPLLISILQFMFCSIVSIITGVATEPFHISMVSGALIPILYSGLISVGIGYTLQVVGQKYSPPHHAAVIMSMESVFAVIGAVLILHENVSGRMAAGCSLMLAGMITAQIGRSASGTVKENKPVP